MESKGNCWEVKNCGRQPDGAKVAELGCCPATMADHSTGVNGGNKGGRICWAVSGTLCGGRVQGTFAQKLSACSVCDFYKQVHREEGAHFVVVLR